ncbi:hypothetical protein EXIGLDRAFT_731903 [Exidia glandulosa HHB12029]|uniref:RNI-like protein n=1 Tax=Exidia glandulosa HHB12029 TaxID=1314781 RepID=A0A165BQJ1_EXIGL|nr:hypothetical protein EXIGLDRAFT_731903 [Exidia glandulosa HHB12029]
MHGPSPHPNVVVRFAGWDGMKLLDACIVPALRHGSTRTLRVIIDDAILHRTLHIDNPHSTIFHAWGYAITSLHVDRILTHNLAFDAIGLFHALATMPSLVELSIQVNRLEHLAPVKETPNISFHLARLDLRPVFRGWPRLIARSAGTLRELALHGVQVPPLEYGTFLTSDESQAYSASLRSVTHLRLSNCFDPAIVRACPTLRTLYLNSYQHPSRPGSRLNGPVTCLDIAPRTLQHLVLAMDPWPTDLRLTNVFDLLASRPSVVAGLRSVTVQRSREWQLLFQELLDNGEEGREARDVLQTFCLEHRILFSLD